MINSGTTVSTPTAGNKECNDIKSYLPITKRPEVLFWPFCYWEMHTGYFLPTNGTTDETHCIQDVPRTVMYTSTQAQKNTCHHSTQQHMASHSTLLWATNKYSWSVLPHTHKCAYRLQKGSTWPSFYSSMWGRTGWKSPQNHTHTHTNTYWKYPCSETEVQ